MNDSRIEDSTARAEYYGAQVAAAIKQGERSATTLLDTLDRSYRESINKPLPPSRLKQGYERSFIADGVESFINTLYNGALEQDPENRIEGKQVLDTRARVAFMQDIFREAFSSADRGLRFGEAVKRVFAIPDAALSSAPDKGRGVPAGWQRAIQEAVTERSQSPEDAIFFKNLAEKMEREGMGADNWGVRVLSSALEDPGSQKAIAIHAFVNQTANKAGALVDRLEDTIDQRARAAMDPSERARLEQLFRDKQAERARAGRNGSPGEQEQAMLDLESIAEEWMQKLRAASPDAAILEREVVFNGTPRAATELAFSENLAFVIGQAEEEALNVSGAAPHGRIMEHIEDAFSQAVQSWFAEVRPFVSEDLLEEAGIKDNPFEDSLDWQALFDALCQVEQPPYEPEPVTPG